MLRDIIDGNLSDYVRENGGAGYILYNGRKTTEEMYFQAMFGTRGYRFTLKPTPKDTFIITDEARYYKWGVRVGGSYGVVIRMFLRW